MLSWFGLGLIRQHSRNNQRCTNFRKAAAVRRVLTLVRYTLKSLTQCCGRESGEVLGIAFWEHYL
jgi:hypothetical protein